MVTCLIIIEQDPTSTNLKVGVKFTNKDPSKDEIEYAADVNAILEAYSKESGKLMEGGQVLGKDTIVAECPIHTTKNIIHHMKTSGKNWEQLEPFVIAQIEKCSFRPLSEKEWKSYDKDLVPKIKKQVQELDKELNERSNNTES